MAREIGRLNQFGIGIETTKGTAVGATVWIPAEEASLQHRVENVKNESGYGVIEANADAHITQVSSEFSASGIVFSNTIGYMLLLALGQVAAPALQETGVYKHAFTRKNDNNHPSATILKENSTQDEQSAYHMADSLSMSFEVGDYMKYEFSSMGKGVATATGLTPAYIAEEAFKTSKVYVKFATDIAGLGVAAKVAVQSGSIEIAKNLEAIYSTATTSTDAVELSSQHNKQLEISGEFEMVYDSTTYKTLANNLTKQAIEIAVEGTTLIGATKYNTLTIRVASAVLENLEESGGLDDIRTVTFGFVGLYKLAETKSIEIDLINTKSTSY